VLETHNHNDYVTGGYELSRVTGATYVMAAAEETFFEFHGVADGDELQVGTFTVRAMHTPGHTPTHLSYVASDGEHHTVFTGGSLLYGSVGRTDLISRAMREELTRHQHATAHRLARELPDETTVLPTHGFGSFCSSAAADETTSNVDPKYGVEISTIGEQKRANIALTITDADEFVRTLVDGLDAYPRYYAHMAPRNKVGPHPVDLSPPWKPTRPSWRVASTPASGSSTCARAPRTRQTTSPARSTSRSATPSSPTSPGSCRGAPPSRSSVTPRTRSRRRSGSWCASASTVPRRRRSAAPIPTVPVSTTAATASPTSRCSRR
jgi:glyoxylase-like metal-dependent hydrolase (beta-lactamase superfamily II)